MGNRGRKPRPWQEVLTYRLNGPKRTKGLRAAYLKYRAERNLPYRCDINNCIFHDPASGNFQSGKPVWKGETGLRELPLIVDHVNGQPRDNNPHNLRLICPNCAFQLGTHAGANRGRVKSEDQWGYVLRGKKGQLEFTYFPSGGIGLGGSAIVE
jgi:hypothetical protein